jgi:UDP-N-acetylglucosamine 2-epimerase
VFGEIIKALDGKKGVKLIFTGSNADTGGNSINKMINKYVSDNPGRAVAFKSLGQRRYFSALRCVDAVVGNSSSGVIEAPSFGIPTVNVGDRQKGRIKAKSVIDCRTDAASISRAIDKAFSNSFRKICGCVANPYDGGDNVSSKIVEALKAFDLDKDFLKKRFHDIGVRRRFSGK